VKRKSYAKLSVYSIEQVSQGANTLRQYFPRRRLYNMICSTAVVVYTELQDGNKSALAFLASPPLSVARAALSTLTSTSEKNRYF